MKERRWGDHSLWAPPSSARRGMPALPTWLRPNRSDLTDTRHCSHRPMGDVVSRFPQQAFASNPPSRRFGVASSEAATVQATLKAFGIAQQSTSFEGDVWHKIEE